MIILNLAGNVVFRLLPADKHLFVNQVLVENGEPETNKSCEMGEENAFETNNTHTHTRIIHTHTHNTHIYTHTHTNTNTNTNKSTHLWGTCPPQTRRKLC